MKLYYPRLTFIILITSFCVTYSHASERSHGTRQNDTELKLNQTQSNTFSKKNVFSEKTKSDLIEQGALRQEECDTIILNDGKIIRVNIKSTSESDVRYTNCENDDTLELIISKNDIKAIQYANGTFEFVKHKSAEDKFKEEQRTLQKEKAVRLEEKAARLESGGDLYKNSIYGSFSFALVYGSGTIFYERILKQNSSKDKMSFYAKIGIGTYAAWESEGSYLLGNVGILTGNKSHHFESSFGMLHHFKGDFVNDVKENPLSALSTSIGYRYQRPQGHFIFRTGIGWPEALCYVSLGVSF